MEGGGALDAVELFVVLVAAATFVGLLIRRIAVPYTVGLVVLGLGAAIFIPTVDFEVTPDLVLAVLLPGLIFDAAYRLEYRALRQALGGVVLLAVPGVLIVAVLVATVLMLATGLPFELGFVIGAMLSATDPAAVITTFKRLGSPRRLATLIEGESLFNDGTGLVVFVLALEAVGAGIDLGDAGLRFLTTVVVSLAIGGLAGFLASRVIATVDDHLIELSISLVAAYGTYLLADSFQESGIIATVVAGVVIGNYGQAIGMSERTRQALDTVWEFTAFLLSALVFLLVGLAISLPQILDASVYAFWAIVAVLIGRAISVYGLVGGASIVFQGRRVGWPLPVAWLHVMFWSGLRGAVAVALALSLPLDFPQRLLLQEITFSVVLFTLLIQGTTIELVIRRTGAGTDTLDHPRAPA